MSSTDIEYHIKFPVSTTRQLSSNSDDDFVHVGKEEKCPVVFLLGWLGCKDKHLARYSQIYEDFGCITVRCCVPPSSLILHHYRYPNLARRLLDLITDMSLDEHPIFFHVFSNGGCFLYQYIVNEMRLAESKLDVRGTILDSAPGKIRPTSVFKTIMALPIGFTPVRFMLALLSCGWMYILHYLMIILHKTVDVSFLSGDVFANLLRAPVNQPQLFIYSVDDKLVMSQDIDEFLKEREERGVVVTKCKFQCSPHVMHIVAHKEEYINAIHKHLQNCLRRI